MPQSLAENSLHEKRRNMSKRGFDLATTSNIFRMLFDTDFNAFESPTRKAGEPSAFLRIRSNALERVEALHA
jgi:hypothetical protein